MNKIALISTATEEGLAFTIEINDKLASAEQIAEEYAELQLTPKEEITDIKTSRLHQLNVLLKMGKLLTSYMNDNNKGE